MKTICYRSLLIGFALPLAAIIFMGAYDVLDRYKAIKAKEIQIIDDQGMVVLSLSDVTKITKRLEDRIIELENKEIDSADNDAYDNLERNWVKTSSKIDALQSDLRELDDDLQIIKNLKDGMSDELDKQSSDLSRIDREAVRYNRLVKRIEDKIQRMDADIKSNNSNCANSEEIVNYLSNNSFPGALEPGKWPAQGCAPLLLNCPNLCEDVQAILDDFEENIADYMYKYYRASKKADKDIKNEKRRNK